MPTKYRVMKNASGDPLWDDTVEKASRGAASQRTADAAHWAHSLEQTGSRLSERDFEALWRECPDWPPCEARRVCLLALARALRVWRARNAIKSMRRA